MPHVEAQVALELSVSASQALTGVCCYTQPQTITNTGETVPGNNCVKYPQGDQGDPYVHRHAHSPVLLENLLQLLCSA